MRSNQNAPRPFYTPSQAVAYALGGLFLLKASSTYAGGTSALIGQILGGILTGFAFFLAMSSFFGKLVAWANRIDMWLFMGLFFAAMASLVKTAVESTEHRAFHIGLVAAFLSIILAAMLFQLYKTGANLRTESGPSMAWVRLLRGLSVALSMFALAMVIMQVSIMGGPILYLAISVICLGVASLLQRTA